MHQTSMYHSQALQVLQAAQHARDAAWHACALQTDRQLSKWRILHDHMSGEGPMTSVNPDR